jgi:hypothetical protein
MTMDPRAARLWAEATGLLGRGLLITMTKINWNVETGKKQLDPKFSPPKNWHTKPPITADDVTALIRAGCNAYLYRLPDDVWVVDADNAEAVRIALEHFGTPPAVTTRKGGHWLFKSPGLLELEGTVFDSHQPRQLYGPGSYYDTPDGPAAYTGAVPDLDTLPEPPAALRAALPRRRVSAGPSMDGPGSGFFATPPATAEQVRTAIFAALDRIATGDEGGPGAYGAIRDAAFLMGGYLHTEWYTWEEAETSLLAACARRWGEADDDDAKNIVIGLTDGDKPGNRLRAQMSAEEKAQSVPELGPHEDDDDALSWADYDDTYVPPVPSLLDLGWEVPLLYQGTPDDPRSNMLFGLPGCGKTWLAAIAAVQRANAGERVWYVDYENSRPSLVARLKAVGLTREATRLITYTRAAVEPPADTHARLAAAASGRYGLVVIDGMNGALNSLGFDENSTGDVTKWYQRFVSVVPTVLILDHTAKSPDGFARRTAIGSQAKEAALSGVAWSMEKLQAFGTNGGRGLVKLVLGKDRPGGIEGRVASGELLADVFTEKGGGRLRIEVRTMMGEAVSPEEAVFEAMRVDGVDVSATEREFQEAYRARNAGKGVGKARVRAVMRQYAQHVVEAENPSPFVNAVHVTTESMPLNT